ncbi:MgtC/SapB family protein [Kitasatospora sp. NPDC056138]|uniref:MgtC/SapB family protein n=1 Tax=Kitasatospora sp. NPDC056138 TaxID=3345724 RepID=UPI0035DC5A05
MLCAGVDEPFGQSWVQVAQFGLALLLSCVIGLEREIRQKAAGLRTYTIVGLGSALFTLISKYGFTDVLRTGLVSVDPSRMAAQIVSGLGFIGAGVIFVQRGSVRGLTTAATIWLTAAVGAAAAAGLPLLAALATGAYFLVCYGLRPLAHRLPQLRSAPTTYRITYVEGTGLLRELLNEVTESGFAVAELTTIAAHAVEQFPSAGAPAQDGAALAGYPLHGRVVEVSVSVRGHGDRDELTARLAGIPGVLACSRNGLADE